jgi:hypothetical protein
MAFASDTSFGAAVYRVVGCAILINLVCMFYSLEFPLVILPPVSLLFKHSLIEKRLFTISVIMPVDI